MRSYFIDIGVLVFYIPVMLLVFSQGYHFGLFFSNDSFLIMLNYITVTTGTILTLLYFIQLEFSIMNQKKIDLTDKYSHNMGNNLQTIMLTIELLKSKEYLKGRDPLELVRTVEGKVSEVNKLLEEIRRI